MTEKKDSSKEKEKEEPRLPHLSEEEAKRIDALSYEAARDELVATVQTLESGGLSLEDSLLEWEKGEALSRRAQGLLSAVRSQLDAVKAEQEANSENSGTQKNMSS